MIDSHKNGEYSSIALEGFESRLTKYWASSPRETEERAAILTCSHLGDSFVSSGAVVCEAGSQHIQLYCETVIYVVREWLCIISTGNIMCRLACVHRAIHALTLLVLFRVSADEDAPAAAFEVFLSFASSVGQYRYIEPSQVLQNK